MSSFTSNVENHPAALESEIEASLNQALIDCNDCLNRADFPAALASLNRAVDLAPRNLEILNHRGRLLLFLKKFDLARADFDQAVRVDSSHPSANSGLARCHFEKGSYNEAEACTRRALALDPENQEAADILSALEKFAGTKSVKVCRDIQLASSNQTVATTMNVEHSSQPASALANIDLDSGLTLEIGAHSYIHDHKIQNPSGALTDIIIGKFCSIATGLTVIGYDHHSEWAAMYPFLDDGHRANWPGTDGIPYPQSQKFGSNKSRGDIEIGNDVWIGSDVKLFKGVVIGNGAVIGACSLVNKSVEPYTVVAGIPARPLRKRFSETEISLLQKVKWWDLPETLVNRHMALLCSSRIAELEQALEADPDFQTFKQGGGVTVPPVRIQPKNEPLNPVPEQLDVIQTIGSGDEMFTGDKAHYFGVGKSALHGIETALFAAGQPHSNIRKILDLPCGHGRVMRYFKAAFPQARITACDLNRSAVNFCTQTFAAQPVYSNVDVGQIPLAEKYDLIWSGSLLTHLRAEHCAEFVRLFHSLVNPGGLIVFTLHGRWVERSLATNRYTYGLKSPDVAALLKEYYATGFGYADYPGVSGYGISLSSPAYVLSQLVALPDLKLISYQEKGWDNHQDIVCLQKQPPGEPLG